MAFIHLILYRQVYWYRNFERIEEWRVQKEGFRLNVQSMFFFDFILDGGNNILWRSSVTDVAPLTEEPYGFGSIFKQGVNGPGGRVDGDYKIIECRINRLIRFAVMAGPIRYTGIYKFTTDGDSTVVTFVLDFQVGWIFKLVEPMIIEAMESEVAMLSNLKAYLEENFENFYWQKDNVQQLVEL